MKVSLCIVRETIKPQIEYRGINVLIIVLKNLRKKCQNGVEQREERTSIRAENKGTQFWKCYSQNILLLSFKKPVNQDYKGGFQYQD